MHEFHPFKKRVARPVSVKRAPLFFGSRIYYYIYLLFLGALIAAVLLFLGSRLSHMRDLRSRIDVKVDGKCAVIVEASTGRAVYLKQPRKRYPPASTAKVMTAIVALEQHSPREKITVGRGVLQIEPTIAGLKPGVEYSLEDLLAAILIKSANDAAFAIAEYAGGSEKRFASMMNRKAAEIGMYDTFFATASGLPTGRVDSQYTTAYDLALLMRYALRFDIITSLMSRKEKTIRGGDGKDIHLRTHNRALYRYDDAPWGKTGYTREAKRTFSGTDPEEPHSITFGLLQSDSLWTDVIELKRKGMALFRALNTSYTELLIDWVRMERQEAKKVFYGRG